jgi:DNA-binding NarL/FixJ family response regulator
MHAAPSSQSLLVVIQRPALEQRRPRMTMTLLWTAVHRSERLRLELRLLMIATVLIADDHAEFRNFIKTMLNDHPGFRIIAEAPDGLTAVQFAEELKPTLVLLDMTMPWMNGLEAARQIRTVSPASKILFLTENASPELAKRALDLGASGYLIKSFMRELYPALEAVILGGTYVSQKLRPNK